MKAAEERAVAPPASAAAPPKAPSSLSNGLRALRDWVSQAYKSATTKDVCTLSLEDIEEIHMITGYPKKEIVKYYSKFMIYSGDGQMALHEFSAIPAIHANPLKDQIVKCLEFDKKTGNMSFKDFMVSMSQFSHYQNREVRLRAAFRMHDFDDDGKISKKDLETYLRRTTRLGEAEAEPAQAANGMKPVTVEEIVDRVMEEASSDPEAGVITFEDFIKATAGTDVESRTVIDL